MNHRREYETVAWRDWPVFKIFFFYCTQFFERNQKNHQSFPFVQIENRLRLVLLKGHFSPQQFYQKPPKNYRKIDRISGTPDFDFFAITYKITTNYRTLLPIVCDAIVDEAQLSLGLHVFFFVSYLLFFFFFFIF